MAETVSIADVLIETVVVVSEAMKPWQRDVEQFDATGKQSAWRSTNLRVPAKYRLDLESVCYGNAERLAKMAPHLKYVEGHARLHKGTWGNHAWCETKHGEVVDPYFEWMFPGRKIQYRKTK